MVFKVFIPSAMIERVFWFRLKWLYHYKVCFCFCSKGKLIIVPSFYCVAQSNRPRMLLKINYKNMTSYIFVKADTVTSNSCLCSVILYPLFLSFSAIILFHLNYYPSFKDSNVTTAPSSLSLSVSLSLPHYLINPQTQSHDSVFPNCLCEFDT